MPTPWGATPEDWQLFSRTLGLTADLLPVVSNPGAAISPMSKMAGLGKTPSKYNANGEVSGIKDWTQKQTLSLQVKKWSENPDYGICVQTRRVRAIDIDVENQDEAEEIVAEIVAAVGHLPHRTRAGSGKSLLAFRLDGEFPKRILEVHPAVKDAAGKTIKAAENIEFLGNGQQFIACGTHPKGQRYTWDWHGWDDACTLPVLTETQFNNLWDGLCKAFGTEESVSLSGPRKRGKTTQKTDPVVAMLDGLILGEGRDGQLYLDCPWKEGHSSDTGIAQTCYFPAGSGGYEQGHFKCLHASCAKRTPAEWADAFGLREDMFLGGAADAEPVKPEGWSLPLLRRNKANECLPTMQNVTAVLKHPAAMQIGLAWDNFRDVPLVSYAGKERRPLKDADYGRMRVWFDANGFLPVGRELMRDACQLVLDENRIDTAQDWLAGVGAWDGVERVDRFLCGWLGAEDSAYTRAVSRYLWTALAGRILAPGCKADMAVILSGAQGTGKSGMCRLLAPFEEAFCTVNFADSEDAIARRIKGVCVAELGELKGLANRDLETVKSLVTTAHDKWVPKYQENAVVYPRRALFIGTTNEVEFLADPTGNRRWLPVRVGGETAEATAGERAAGVHAFAAFKKLKAQFFAEAKVKYLVDGVAHVEAEKLGRDVHARHMVHDSWSDMVGEWLLRADVDGTAPVGAPWLRLGDVLRGAVNMSGERIERRHELRMGGVLAGMGYVKKVREIGGKPQKVWILRDESMQ